jgi:hypothetical protein
VRQAASDSRQRARVVTAALLALAILAAWALAGSERPEPAAAQSGTCAGDATATLTVTDSNGDGAEEASVDTAIPASCDIGVRSDGRSAQFWSIDVYDAGDPSKRYFCHRGTDAPPGEPSCSTPQPTNPTPDSDVTAQVVRESGIWRLYVHLNTRVPSHSLNLRAHYGWKGTGPATDQCPSEPGTGPCTEPDPTGGRFDLAVTLKTVFNVEPTDRFVPATFTVRNTGRAQGRSPKATLTVSILTELEGGQLGRVNLDDVKLGDAALIDCAPVPESDQFMDCKVPSLAVNSGLEVPLQVPASAERISLLGITAGTGVRCGPATEITCTNNNTSEYNVNVPAPETKVEQPDLSNTGEVFNGSSSPSESQVMRIAARAAASAPRVRRVEIALLRKRGDVRAVAVPRCSWLRNGRAKFERVRAGATSACDRPVWLKAKGITRWRFEGAEPLPKGRYVLYARAIDAAGHTTSRFSKKRGNRVAFRVR